MKSFNQVKTKLLKDKEFREAYEALGPEFTVIEALIEQRLKKGLTQADLAKKIGTKQAAISRFESGTTSPRIDFLYRLADAIGARIKVELK